MRLLRLIKQKDHEVDDSPKNADKKHRADAYFIKL
jgi:hypothetical protein